MQIPATQINAAGGGAMQLLEQHTAATSATLDFTTAITSTYDQYRISLINVLPVTDSVEMYLRVSTDGGSSYDSAANYTWNHTFMYSSASVGTEGGDPVGFIGLGAAVKNSGGGVVGSIDVYAPLNASATKAFWCSTMRYHATLNTYVRDVGGGIYNSNTAVNALRFLFSSGNIASGTIRMYGIVK